MNVMSYLAGAAQIGGVAVGAPLVIGLMRQVRARSEGRSGGGILQPWRDLRKQLRKQQITPDGTTLVFGTAPAIVAGTTLLIAAITPLIATGSPLDPSADLFAVVGLLFLGTVALTLAGIDTGTSFGGMGASREITIAALVEPTHSARHLRVVRPRRLGQPRRRRRAYHAQPRASRLAGRSPCLRRAGHRHRRRNRQAPGGQPGHPPRAHHGARGDGARIRGTEARGRRMGERHATYGAAGTTGKPVRCPGALRVLSRASSTSSWRRWRSRSKWPSWPGRWPARRSSSPSCDCSACPSCLPVRSYWHYSPSCRPTSSPGRSDDRDPLRQRARPRRGRPAAGCRADRVATRSALDRAAARRRRVSRSPRSRYFAACTTRIGHWSR